MIKTLPEEVEAYRDRMWRREPESRVESAVEAEKFVEAVGFCATMTGARGLEGSAQGVGDGDVRPAAGVEGRRARAIHARARRVAEDVEGHPAGGSLRALVHVHLDAQRVALRGGAFDEGAARGGSARGRARVP